MLIAEGVSDGTEAGVGDGFWSVLLSVLPLLLSAVAIVFTAVSIVINMRKSARDRLWSYLQLLISAETSRARAVVGQAARWEPPAARARMVKLTQAENNRISAVGEPHLDAWKAQHADYRDAIFQLLWVVALAAPTLGGGLVHRLVVGRSTDRDRALVYQHLNLIVPDLHQAFDFWAKGADSSGSAGLADASLDALPKVQLHDDGQIHLTEQRFAVPTDGATQEGDSE